MEPLPIDGETLLRDVLEEVRKVTSILCRDGARKIIL